MIDTPTINLYFHWESFMPDRRDFKPSSPILYPESVMVTISLPLISEYVSNLDKVLAAQLDEKSDLVETILTPKGMRYCIDQFELAMMPVKVDLATESEVKWEENNTVSDKPVKEDDGWTPQFDEGDAGKADEDSFDETQVEWEN